MLRRRFLSFLPAVVLLLALTACSQFLPSGTDPVVEQPSAASVSAPLVASSADRAVVFASEDALSTVEVVERLTR